MGDEKPTTKLFGLTISSIILLVIVVILLILLPGLSQYLETLKNIFFSFTLVILSLLFFIIILTLSKWIVTDEGLVIQPFNIGGWDENKGYNSHAIADSLIRELIRIRMIHNSYGEIQVESGKHIVRESPMISKDAKTPKNFPKISVTPSSENIAYNIANLGTASQGGMSISIGQLLITLKRLSGSPGSIITGSLQKYGHKISIVAWMGLKEGRSWEVHRDIDQENGNQEGKSEEIIPDLIRELAFKISKDIAGTSAKTCCGFKHFTEALNDLYWYRIDDDDEKLNSSRERCLKAVEIDKKYVEAAELLSTIGIEYFHKEEFSQARELFEYANELKKNDIDILILLGTTLDILDKDEEALKKLDKAIEIAELNLREERTYWKRIFYSLKNLIRKIMRRNSYKVISPVKELENQLFLAYNNRSSVLYDLGKYDLGKYVKAKKDLDNAEKMAKNDEELLKVIWYNKGYILSIMEKYDKAADYLKKAINHKFALSSAYNIRGIIRSKQFSYKEAIKDFEMAIEKCKKDLKWDIQGLTKKYKPPHSQTVDPMKIKFNYSHPLINKSWALSNLQRYEEAIECYDKAIQQEIEPEWALINKGRILRYLGKDNKANKCYENAKKLCENAIGKDRKDLDAWNNKGNVHLFWGDYKEAEECYEEALKIDKENVDAWNGKGKALYYSENYEKALECYERAIEIVPDYVDAWNSKGNVLNNLKKYEKALECYEEAIKIDQDNVDALNNKGKALVQLGKNKKALTPIQKSLDLNSENALAWKNKADALFGLNKHKKAMECYDKARKIDPRYLNAYYGSVDAFNKSINLQSDSLWMQS